MSREITRAVIIFLGMTAMVIERLLGEIPVTRFMQDHYFKIPLAVPGGCRFLTGIGTGEQLVRLLQDPRSDSIISRQGQRWDKEGPPTAAETEQLLQEGYTLGIRHAHQHDAALAALAADFERDFAAEVDIHLYCTPATTAGFGWHYDAEEVFVLQTQGSKEWSLRKNTVNPWPIIETLPADMKYEREIMPLMRCSLAEGDWLYIPAGYWHRTHAEARSISLSVGLRSITGIDVYDFLRQRLLDSLLWRCRLPAAGEANGMSPEELTAAYRQRFEELARDLQRQLEMPQLLRDFLAAQRERSANDPGTR